MILNNLNSLRKIVDSSQSVVNTVDYKPFGEILSGDAGNHNYLFTGREKDFNDLYYYRARTYSPLNGRFMQKDPIGIDGGLNLYGYCGNNPVNYCDPLGLAAYRKQRPLDRAGLRDTTIGDLHHDAFQYTDGHDSGYYDDSTVRPDRGSDYVQNQYDRVGPMLNDNILSQAEANIRNDWDQDFNPNAPEYDEWNHNCQDYCDAVLDEYNRLLKK